MTKKKTETLAEQVKRLNTALTFLHKEYDELELDLISSENLLEAAVDEKVGLQDLVDTMDERVTIAEAKVEALELERILLFLALIVATICISLVVFF